MKSLEERLAQSDPSRARSYEPTDLGAMVARVMASPHPRHDNAWRSFRVKMAGSMAAASLLTGLGVTALGLAGSTLPILSFASSPAHSKSDGVYFSVVAPSANEWRTSLSPELAGGIALSSAPARAVAYAMSGPRDGATTLVAVARAVGVDVGRPVTSNGGASYTSKGPRYSGSLARHRGYSTWSIITNPSVRPSPQSMLTDAALLQRAVRLARRTGMSVDAQGSSAGPLMSGAAAQVRVFVPVRANGRGTDFFDEFLLSRVGMLLGAWGQSFTLRSLGEYPLLSPRAGVAQIAAQRNLTPSYLVPATPPTSSIPLGPPALRSGSGGNASTNPLTGPILSWRSVSVRYASFTMVNGSTFLLPTYVYVGVLSHGAHVTFRVVPIKPTYLDLTQVQRPRP